MKVSVVMPVLDGMPHLPASLASLRAQTLPPHEIVVIDGGSTDGSPRACAGARVIEAPELSLAARYTAGAEAATGELIAFAAADDLCHPEKHARQAALIAAGAEAALCAVEGFLDGPAPPGLRPGLLDGPQVMRLPEALMIRREAFWRVGGFREAAGPAGDLDWFARAAHDGLEFAVAGDVLLRKRVHGGSTAHGAATMNAGILRSLRDSIERQRA